MSAKRFQSVIDRHDADGNILAGHPAGRASWIWGPGRGPQDTGFLCFSLDFTWDRDVPLRLHVTADHRYQLFLDGEPVSFGPDRCDVAHWSVTSLEIALAPGPHRLAAFAWLIADQRASPARANSVPANPPMAQMSHRAAFLLCGDASLPSSILDTGQADWQVADLTESVTLSGPRSLGYHDIGPQFAFDLGRWNNLQRSVVRPDVVARPLVASATGVRTPGWVLDTTVLPEQRRIAFSGGRIRAVRWGQDENAPWEERLEGNQDWQTLLAGNGIVEIQPNQCIELLWDMETYQCGYPAPCWSGGTGSTVLFDWAESLYVPEEGCQTTADSPKGHRGEIDGKVWLGFGDAFLASGRDSECPPALWWRSGRYIRLRIRTEDAPLRLSRLGITTTGFPLDREGSWTSSDAEWDGVFDLMGRGLELGAHEIWADSPFYEQMAYVGDNALHMLSNYIGYEDTRLCLRALQLFDWSRADSQGGLVAERYPSAWRQESATYAMLYPAMVRNHLLWRGDEGFLHKLLPGVRQLLESLLSLRRADGLLGRVPGWPFIDWVPGWDLGCGPGAREGDSSIVNLHLILALQAASELETHLGEEILARRFHHLALGISEKIWHRCWDETRALLLDTPGGECASEHAQVLALLTGLLPQDKHQACLQALLGDGLTARCTIYFSHYLLEVLAAERQADAFFSRLKFWRTLPQSGFTALPESPDPCRSDCHAWGAHPFFHTLASIAGIRPAAPGFRSVAIRPMPGHITRFDAVAVHPEGKIRVRFDSGSAGDHFRISLPPGIGGCLDWHRTRHPLSGDSEVFVPLETRHVPREITKQPATHEEL